jgi:protein O-mannosyl-transferase
MPRIRRDCLAALVLAGTALLTFLPALRCDFVNFDDFYYITKNESVKNGLSLAGTRWAFNTYYQANWHPLTWVSLQLDAALWRRPDGGLDARGFHLTNMALHAANAALLFLALKALTGAFWRSAVVALLFAVHPLRVESVAWVTERKDVLSAFFGLLALWAYSGYAARPSIGRYLAVMLPFALSLMAKPMLVTLPFLLLLLDWWPLQRARSVQAGARLLAEKIPLIALVAVACFVTFQVQRDGGAMRGLDMMRLDFRIKNALASYVVYLRQTVWPAHLVAYYALSLPGVSTETAEGAALLLVTGIAAGIVLRRRAPYLLVGWLWYLGMLVPVIGLVQVGNQAHADRYTYLPQVGILLAVSWGVADAARARPRAALAMAAAGALALAVVTWNQLAMWTDSVTLWKRDLVVDPNSPIGWYNLGCALEEKENRRGAGECYAKAVGLSPKYAEARLSLGAILQKQGKLKEAVRQFEACCNIEPESLTSRIYLARALTELGDLPEAAKQYRTALHLAPMQADGYCKLGCVEAMRHDYASAFECFDEALRLEPDSAEAHSGLALVLLDQKRVDEAIDQLNQAIRCEPRSEKAQLVMGKVLETRNDLNGAASHFEEATRLDPDSDPAWHDLGRLRSRQGRLVDAANCLARAVELKPSSDIYRRELTAALHALDRAGQPELALDIMQRIPAAVPPGSAERTRTKAPAEND